MQQTFYSVVFYFPYIGYLGAVQVCPQKAECINDKSFGADDVVADNRFSNSCAPTYAKPKFHYNDFATKSQTFHVSCHGLNFIIATETDL